MDAERCTGHNRCAALAPTLFDIDDYGFASARGDGTVEHDLEPAARAAVLNCPERAVTLQDAADEATS